MIEIKKLKKSDKNYPALLTRYSDSPNMLYYKSNKDINLNDYIKVAIVGARDASPYALKVAHDFAYELAKNGIIIVSGMAKGVDTAAHKGALEAGGLTVAVLGNGLDIVYPKENMKLMEDIIDNGIVFSEYPEGTEPLKINFPQRNRIISGLSNFVLVVEAKEKSGSLITARIALDYGLDVGVIPSNIGDPNSKGSNMLLRDGAYPVLEVRDILELL